MTCELNKNDTTNTFTHPCLSWFSSIPEQLFTKKNHSAESQCFSPLQLPPHPDRANLSLLSLKYRTKQGKASLNTEKFIQIFFLAGEPSGDLLGAKLAQQLAQQHPDWHLTGVGGDQMQQASVSLLTHIREIAIMGFLDVIRKASTLRKIYKSIKQHLKKTRPQLLILIDYPGLNLKIAQYAHSLDLKILYYVSPKIWAHGANRIQKIQQSVDHMAVLFPFEVTLYQRANVPVTYVGHPTVTVLQNMLVQFAAHPSAEFSNNLSAELPSNLQSEWRIALLPGSRVSEIQHHLPLMLQSAARLKRQFPQATFHLAVAPNLNADWLQQQLFQMLQTLPLDQRLMLCDAIALIIDQRYEQLTHCQAAIVTSGTMTLELACLKIPMVVIYQFHPLWIATHLRKYVVKTRFVSLCNILVDAEIVPELLQYDATPEKISSAIACLLNNPCVRQAQIAGFEKMLEIFASLPSHSLADLVEKLIGYQKDTNPALTNNQLKNTMIDLH